MIRRTTLALVEFTSCVVMFSAVRIAIGATAVALIGVTVVGPVISHQSMMAVHPRQLDMTGKTSEELTLINQSTEWRELRIELDPPSGSVPECTIRYSPKTASLPPGGIQVLRLMLHGASPQICQMDHTLVVADLKDPVAPLFEVPIRINQSAGTYGKTEFFHGAP